MICTVGNYTLIRDAQGHEFRMSHGQTPPKGFTEIPDVCMPNGLLKNKMAWAFDRIQFALNGSKLRRKYSTLTDKQIDSLKTPER
jgi:hypothetical protein